MAVAFLKRILEKFCNHRFSWPHGGIDGRDYQVCLICGTIYEYDWARMRRTRRVASTASDQDAIVKTGIGLTSKPN